VLPGPSDLALQLLDASALLWRLHLEGAAVGDRWTELADAWEAKIDAEGGFYAFNDCHALMALAVTERSSACARLLSGLEAAASGRGLPARMAREVGLPVARGLLSFARGRYDDALSALEPVRDLANVFGGSHAQRDLITLTIVEAALRAGRPSLARHYIAERNVQRPSSALGWRLRSRARDDVPRARDARGS